MNTPLLPVFITATVCFGLAVLVKWLFDTSNRDALRVLRNEVPRLRDDLADSKKLLTWYAHPETLDASL